MRLARRVAGVVFFVAVLVFGWQFAASNSQRVAIFYLWGSIEDVPLWAVMVAAFGLGAAAVFVLGLYPYTRLGMVARRYRRTVNDLESEVHQLRNLPLSTDEPPDAGSDEPVAALPSPQALERGA